MCYWKRDMRDRVGFGEGMRNILEEENIELIEIGGGEDLRVMVKGWVKGVKEDVCDVLRDGKEDVRDREFLVGEMGGV
ncbi:hypothetical protein, partial [Bacillus pumilus]|uniref:hypothetical protein n=1 Tax=Bacillus pumilus TaxID=1408 RepID=UPI00119DD033